MAYLFLILALISLTVKGYCGKKTAVCVQGPGDPLLFNLLRILLCVVIGAAVVLLERAGAFLKAEGGMLLICLLAGAANAAFLAGWLMAIQKNPLVTVDVGLTVGSILPAVLCAVFFGEAISPFKMIGFALIVTATAVLSGYNKSLNKKTGVWGVCLLLIAALGDGLSAFCQQLYKQHYTLAGTKTHGVFYPKSVYHFYTYVFAAAVLLLIFAGMAVYLFAKQPGGQRAGFAKGLFASCKRPMPYIILMAVCLFAANYFQTMATNDYGMSAEILYPVIKGGCLITVNITAMLFFGEKPNRRSIIGSVIALAGIVAMNIL